ncbi:protein translocase subunit SecD [Alicyclobacillus cellulosilyticus]|uniref:Protein translocase subunit SecD n=1 Tax=Alicyclobacillus cellulosilyticus TaxID=1003997 RepID=A0A917KAN5_9BACL|nr:protein translocase subunit SecD [Alicyclobacillus cellulosilyticus]GGJ06109.1 protein translocase subunit SecD [Alicyclobacillus cellulosilyticus]
MRWGRFGAFLAIAVAIVGLTAGTALPLWKSIRLGLDLQGGFDLLYQIEPTKGHPLTPSGIQAALQAVEMRVNRIGTGSPVIELENGNQIRVELAGVFNHDEAKKIIGETAELEIYGKATQRKDGSWQPDPKTLLMTGDDLKSDAHWSTDPNTGENGVTVNFKDPQKWENITKAYLGKPIYIFLNGQLLNDPVVRDIMVNGSSFISGGDLTTPQACIELADALNAGALPYPLRLVSQTDVGPSLGAASLRATMWAGLAAVCLIFLFMFAVYRLAGLIADLALVAYAYLVLATFAAAQVVLTLPGLAALILGMGMAVDANIITYERMKEEMRNGKSLQSSVVAANRHALRTILDSNTTTFLAAAVMYWVGQGDIRGFAVALMFSILISLLTAVLLSRAMLLLLVRSGAVRRPWWLGGPKGAVSR